MQEFFGYQFDVKNRELYLEGETYNLRYSYFASGQAESEQTALSEKQLPCYDASHWERGYVGALLDPPYRLSISGLFTSKGVSNSQKRANFTRLCDELWGDIDTLEIYAWPPFSNYFDAGLEWWGAYFWTVYSPSHNWIATVLASETD